MDERVVRAPSALTGDTRGQFQSAAAEGLRLLGEGGGMSGKLVVDLSATERVDSAGLSTLVQLQLRAAERRHTVCLRGASEEIRFLLLMTRLDDRFEIEPRA
jgi:anti-anti-sigma factor